MYTVILLYFNVFFFSDEPQARVRGSVQLYLVVLSTPCYSLSTYGNTGRDVGEGGITIKISSVIRN